MNQMLISTNRCLTPFFAFFLCLLLATTGLAQDMNRQATKYSVDAPVTTVALSSKFEYLAFGMKAGGFCVFVANTNKPVFFHVWAGHDKAVTSIAFSPDDKLLASGGLEGEVKIWDPVKDAPRALSVEESKKVKPLLKFKAHTGGVYGLAFSPDGKRLATAGADGLIKMWNRANGELLFSLPGSHKGGARSVVFSPDGQSLITGGMDKTVKIWEAKAGGKATKTITQPAPVYSVAVSPDGQQIAAGGGLPDKPGHVLLMNLEDGKELVDFKGHSDLVYVVAFHPTEARLASCSKDTTIRVWDLEKKEELYMDKHRDPVTGLSFAGDGKYFATASPEIIFLWQGTPKK
jgi:WD40 repeat protein